MGVYHIVSCPGESGWEGATVGGANSAGTHMYMVCVICAAELWIILYNSIIIRDIVQHFLRCEFGLCICLNEVKCFLSICRCLRLLRAL